MLPLTLGCSHRWAKANTCTIYIATDELLNTGLGWTYDVIYRHEQGHGLQITSALAQSGPSQEQCAATATNEGGD